MSPRPFLSPTTLRYAGLIVLAITATLPWWRNHDHLRDFMDYGLVMAANGRMAAGEEPYVDFLTPIQAGFLKLNHAAEVLGGGDYLGLTRGGLALIVITFVGLQTMATRRCSGWMAALIAWAIAVGSAAQHTIIWHNTLGVLCLAAATWAAAIAPILRRETRAWHLVLCVALFVSGINKINFHLVALAGVTGFVVRAAWIDRSGWRPAAVTMAGIVAAGVVAPLLYELVATGASWSQWRYNVITLPTSERSAYLLDAFNPTYWFEPRHNYYGPLWVPATGAIAAGMAVATLIAGWAGRSWRDRGLLVTALAGVTAATISLMLTNHEITYIAAAAGFGLIVAVWFGFGIRPGSGWMVVGVLLPMTVSAVGAWRSAWIGQRSQFGHSASARESYQVLADSAPGFDYVAGLLLPPEMVTAYTKLEAALPPADSDGLRPVFYGIAVEWLERIWPARKLPGLPLWIHDGTTYTNRERQRLAAAITPPAKIESLVIATAWDFWPTPVQITVELFTEMQSLGQLRIYRTSDGLNTGRDPFKIVNLLGLNFQPELLRFTPEAEFVRPKEERIYFGRSRPGTSSFYFDGRVLRVAGDVRVERQSSDSPAGIFTTARFEILRERDGNWESAWRQDVRLAPGEDAATVHYDIEAHQAPLRFDVTLSETAGKRGVAGWHTPLVLDSVAYDTNPPQLFGVVADDQPTDPATAAALIRTEWTPDRILQRGGRVTDGVFELRAGEQIWLRADTALRTLDGTATRPTDATGPSPMLRVVWFKGGRMQLTEQFKLDAATPSRGFHSWSSGYAGWFGLIADPGSGEGAVILRIDRAEPVQ